MPDLINRIHHWIEDEKHWLTRQKIVVFGLTLILIGLLLGLYESGPEPESAVRPDVIDLKIPERRSPPAQPDTADEDPPETSSTQNATNWDSVAVRPGQTLDGIFRKQGLSIPLLHQIIALNGDTKKLKGVFWGF